MSSFQLPIAVCCGITIIAENSHITETKLTAITEAPKFMNWISLFAKHGEIMLREFHVTDVDFFGPPLPNKLGFVKGFGIAFGKDGKKLQSNIAFIRGGAVAVFIVVKVEETQKKYGLFCKQPRFPTGKYMTEVCAGMLDDSVADAQVKGVVFDEIREETGFVVEAKDLMQLGAPIYPSPGGCDEAITLFAWSTTISQAEFEEKQTKIYGNAAENENIQLDFCDMDEICPYLDAIGDAKAEACVRRLTNYK